MYISAAAAAQMTTMTLHLLIKAVTFKVVSLGLEQWAQWLHHCSQHYVKGIAWNVANVLRDFLWIMMNHSISFPFTLSVILGEERCHLVLNVVSMESVKWHFAVSQKFMQRWSTERRCIVTVQKPIPQIVLFILMRFPTC